MASSRISCDRSINKISRSGLVRIFPQEPAKCHTKGLHPCHSIHKQHKDEGKTCPSVVFSLILRRGPLTGSLFHCVGLEAASSSPRRIALSTFGEKTSRYVTSIRDIQDIQAHPSPVLPSSRAVVSILPPKQHTQKHRL